MAQNTGCGDKQTQDAPSRPHHEEQPHVLIGSTGTPVETELLEAQLQSAGLPYLKRFHKGGGLFRSLSSSAAPGADFFVPAALAEEAARILGMDTDAMPAPSASAAGNPARNSWKTQILGLLIVAALLTLYFGLDALLSCIRHLFGAP